MARSPCSSLGASGSEAGFTLVEALVALSLFALLSVLLFGGLRFADRSVSLGTVVTARTADLVLAEEFLRAQLSAAQPLTRAGSDRQPVVAFDGAADHLDFAILPPVYLARGGFHWLRLSRDGAGSGGVLTARWQLIRTGEDQLDAPAEGSTVLLQNVRSVSFSYFGIGGGDQSATWRDTWQGAATLPDLVSIRIFFSDGQTAPQLIVAPRLVGGIPGTR